MLVPNVPTLIRPASIEGKSVALVSRCGVPINSLFSMLKDVCVYIKLLLRTYKRLRSIRFNKSQHSVLLLTCFTTIPPRLWHMNTIGRVFSLSGVSLLTPYRAYFRSILAEYVAFPRGMTTVPGQNPLHLQLTW